MGDQDVKGQCFDAKSGEDFISNLPQSIKDNILVRLNIVEAVRTCILSKRWRYTWCTMPNLVIRSADFNVDRKLDCNKFIGSLLSHHKGPITNFSLSVENFHPDDLDRWIHVLGDKGVKDLSFNFDMRDSCDIPSSFSSRLLSLTDLKFRSRTLDVPQLFRGFKLLRNLELKIATMACADLERLVARCPLLQYLKLENRFESFNTLVIRSQSLETIDLFANYEHLILDTPKLSLLMGIPVVSIADKKNYELAKVSYLTYPDGLLDLGKNIKGLGVGLLKTAPRKLPIKLNHLTQAIIMIDISEEDALVSALLLFKSAPKLQNLDVKLYNSGDLGAYSICKTFWEAESKNVLFNDLKTVIIEPFGPAPVTADCTIAITKFILSTACVLEYLTIKDFWVSFMMIAMWSPPTLESASQSDQATIEMGKAMDTVLEVLKLPRLSNKARITFQEPEHFARREQSKTPQSST